MVVTRREERMPETDVAVITGLSARFKSKRAAYVSDSCNKALARCLEAADQELDRLEDEVYDLREAEVRLMEGG
jgi:MoxR-like ATPase